MLFFLLQLHDSFVRSRAFWYFPDAFPLHYKQCGSSGLHFVYPGALAMDVEENLRRPGHHWTGIQPVRGMKNGT